MSGAEGALSDTGMLSVDLGSGRAQNASRTRSRKSGMRDIESSGETRPGRVLRRESVRLVWLSIHGRKATPTILPSVVSTSAVARRT